MSQLVEYKNIPESAVIAAFAGMQLRFRDGDAVRGGHLRARAKPLSGSPEQIDHVESTFGPEQLPYVIKSMQAFTGLLDQTDGEQGSFATKIQRSFFAGLGANKDQPFALFPDAVAEAVLDQVQLFEAEFPSLRRPFHYALISGGSSGMRLAVQGCRNYLRSAVCGGDRYDLADPKPPSVNLHDYFQTHPSSNRENPGHGSEIWCVGVGIAQKVADHSWFAAKELAQDNRVKQIYQNLSDSQVLLWGGQRFVNKLVAISSLEVYKNRLIKAV